MQSTLLIHTLLITSIAFCSIFTVRSDPNPIRIPTEANKNDGLVLDARGELGRPPKFCPVNCFRTNPVCGVDGVTYWCGCDDARCAGTKVAKKGFCEIGDNRELRLFFLFILFGSLLFASPSCLASFDSNSCLSV